MEQKQPAPQVIIVKEQHDHKLLRFFVFSWFFGIFYWSWLALKWCAIGSWRLTRLTWNWTVAYPVKWSIAASRAAWPLIVRGVQSFHARFGWIGWAVLGAAVFVLGILGNVLNH